MLLLNFMGVELPAGDSGKYLSVACEVRSFLKFAEGAGPLNDRGVADFPIRAMSCVRQVQQNGSGR